MTYRWLEELGVKVLAWLVLRLVLLPFALVGLLVWFVGNVGLLALEGSEDLWARWRAARRRRAQRTIKQGGPARVDDRGVIDSTRERAPHTAGEQLNCSRGQM